MPASDGQKEAAAALGNEELGGDSWIETLPRRGYRYVRPVAVAACAGCATGGMRRAALLATGSISGIVVAILLTPLQGERRDLEVP